MKKGIYLFLMALLIVASTATCKKDKEEADKPAPEIPPESTFVMDFSKFNSTSDTSHTKALADSTYRAWLTSFLNVVFWNTVLTVHAIIPVAAFREAFNHSAKYDGKDKWIWEYTVTANNGTYTASLEAILSGNNISWFMYLTKSGEYERFLWYTGLSSLDGKTGNWLLYYSPAKPEPYIQIVWSRDPSSSTGQIKYTNVLGNDPGYGGYIQYGLTTSSPYNANYTIFYKEQNKTTKIEWNTSSRKGRISDSKSFNDGGAWHCWNELLQDMICN